MHSHSHEHHTENRLGQRRRLAFVLVLAASYMGAEIVGGLLTGSLALLADAGHMLTDVAALSLSLFAIWLAQRPAGVEQTFGYHRVEIIAALANGVALIAVALFIVVEAIERLGNPSEVLGLPMLLVALGGLIVNLIGLFVLSGSHGDNLNVRGAWLHVLSDALGSVGAITAGALVWGLGWYWADPVASLVIAALVVNASWFLLKETVGVLMEAAPSGLDVDEIRSALAGANGVVGVHDLHVWTITSGLISLSCHVSKTVDVPSRDVLTALQVLLKRDFGIEHVTIQIEPEGFEDNGRVC
ncbi:MAG: cation transporter [Deltaproteobacteria bacterium]|nr:cation transporter [Deltaproteobacteria bacterium]MBW2387468.1 cation transporter [Deltaproteobacteria bacterium]MBW2723295.1 cation transporter [Deltaproteobacteria bacterium]